MKKITYVIMILSMMLAVSVADTNSKKDKLKPEQCWEYDTSMFKGWNNEALSKKYVSSTEIKPLEKVLIWRKNGLRNKNF